MKLTPEQLREIVADGIKKAQPKITADAVKAAVATVRAAGGTARAIATLNGSSRTPAAKAEGAAYNQLSPAQRSIIDAARGMTTAPSHVPDKAEIQRAIGSPVPLRNLPDHDQVLAIMVASRGKR